ncbi:MAG: hypothetical protein M3P95_02795, partial [Actinomycetota bacterium]|nr:hypothetical protein [Actinomycetota bacterium]
IGHVDVVDDAQARPCDAAPGGLWPDDAGRRRDVATVDLVRRTAPSTTATAGVGAAPATLVLLVGDHVHDPGLRAALRTAQTPHLAARVREVTGVVGPLVLPGSTPCLDCLDLHRRDRDADWPLLAAQLASPGVGAVPCDTALALAVAGCAALQVLAHVDGEPSGAQAGTLELTPPDHRWRRRSWSLHPGCGCVA